MSRWLNNKVRVWDDGRADIIKPCHSCGFCPYGQLVEEFPSHPEATEFAEQNEIFVYWDKTPHTVEGRTYPGQWSKEPIPGAARVPDFGDDDVQQVMNANGCNCVLFGHDCPVFYLAEQVKESD